MGQAKPIGGRRQLCRVYPSLLRRFWLPWPLVIRTKIVIFLMRTPYSFFGTRIRTLARTIYRLLDSHQNGENCPDRHSCARVCASTK